MSDTGVAPMTREEVIEQQNRVIRMANAIGLVIGGHNRAEVKTALALTVAIAVIENTPEERWQEVIDYFANNVRALIDDPDKVAWLRKGIRYEPMMPETKQ